MPEVGEPQPLLRIEPFGGLDLTTANTILAKTLNPGNDTRDRAVMGYGYVLNRKYGAFVTAKGRARLIALPITQVNGLAEFTSSTATPTYIAAGDSSTLTPTVAQLLSFTAAGTITLLTLPAGFALTLAKPTFFEQYAQWMFMSNATDTPLKIDSSNNVTYWGIVAPTNVVTSSAGAGGAITAVNPFFYAMTFANTVQESSPSPLTGLTGTIVTAQRITVANLQVSTDPQVTTVNVYRLGGDSGQAGQWIYAGSVANGVTTFSDNTADGLLTGNTLIQHRDPPQKFNSMTIHKDRVWGFGYPGIAVGTPSTPAGSDVWYSNPFEPWGFNDTDQVLPVGRNVGDDNLVGGTPLGGVLIALKRKSFWAITGNSQADFFAEQLFLLGCSSEASIVYAMGQIFWQSEDSVYTFAGGTYTDIGVLEKAFFADTLTDADRAAATASFQDQTYWISYPTLGITMGFDLRAQEWVQLPMTFSQATWDTAGPSGLFMLGAEPNSGNIDQWFAAETDLGTAQQSSYMSPISTVESPHYGKQFTHAAITIPVIPIPASGPIPTATVRINIITDPGTITQVVSSQTINLMQTGQHRTWVWELPQACNGRSVQVQITVSSTVAVEIDSFVLFGVVDTRFIPNN